MKRLLYALTVCAGLLVPLSGLSKQLYWVALSYPRTFNTVTSPSGALLDAWGAGDFTSELRSSVTSDSNVNILGCFLYGDGNNGRQVLQGYTVSNDPRRGRQHSRAGVFVFVKVSAPEVYVTLPDGKTMVPWGGKKVKFNEVWVGDSAAKRYYHTTDYIKNDQIYGAYWGGVTFNKSSLACQGTTASRGDDYRAGRMTTGNPLRLRFNMQTDNAIPAGTLKIRFKVAVIFTDLWYEADTPRAPLTTDDTAVRFLDNGIIYDKFQALGLGNGESLVDFNITIPATCDLTSFNNSYRLLDHGTLAVGSMNGNTATDNFDVRCNTKQTLIDVALLDPTNVTAGIDNSKQGEAYATLNLCKDGSTPLLQSDLSVKPAGFSEQEIKADDENNNSGLGVYRYDNKWLLTSVLKEVGRKDLISQKCTGEKSASVVLQLKFP